MSYSLPDTKLTFPLVLNFSNLYHMSCVLSEAGLASDAAFTIKEHFSSVPGLKSLNEVCNCSNLRTQGLALIAVSYLLALLRASSCGH